MFTDDSYSPIPFRGRSKASDRSRIQSRDRSPSPAENKSLSPQQRNLETIKLRTVTELCNPYQNRAFINETEHLSILQEQLLTLRSKCIMLENTTQLKDAEIKALKDYVVLEKNKTVNIGEWNLKLAQADAEIQRLNRLVETLASGKRDAASHHDLQEKLHSQEEEFRNRIRRKEAENRESLADFERKFDQAKLQLTHFQQEMTKKNELIQSYETQNLELTRQVTELHARRAHQNANGAELSRIEQKLREHWSDKEHQLMSKVRKMKKQFEDRFQILTQYELKLSKMISRQAENNKALRSNEKNVEQLKFTKRQLVSEIHDLRKQRDLYTSSLNETRRRNRGEGKIT